MKYIAVNFCVTTICAYHISVDLLKFQEIDPRPSPVKHW